MGSCIAAATGVLGATATAQSSFSPEISFADDGMSVDVRGQDVETVTLTTKDGSTHTFDGGLVRYGYNRSATEPLEGWYGTIEQVEASNGSESKVRLNPHYRLDLSVGCSTFETAKDVAELRLEFENATKTYSPPATGGGRQPATFGSPGRSLQEIIKMDNEMCITRNGGCAPPGGEGVSFDCTSVTVSSEEFVNAGAACYSVELTFADGTTEQVGEQGERFEPPVTFSGSGANEGKVIQSVGFSYDQYGDGWFHYENPSAGSCTPASSTTESAGEQSSGEGGDQDSDAASDGTTGSDDAGGATNDGGGSGADATAESDDAGGGTIESGGSESDTGGGASDTGDSDSGLGAGSSTGDGGSSTDDGSTATDSEPSTGDTDSSSGGSGDSSGTDDGTSNDSSDFNWRNLWSGW